MRPDSTVGPERSDNDPDADDPNGDDPRAELDLVAAGEEPSSAAVFRIDRRPDNDVG